MLHNQSPIDSYAGCRWLFLIRYLLRKSSAGCVISIPPRWRSRSGEKCKVIELGSNEVVAGHRAWMMWDGQLVLDILALVSTYIIWCYVWSDSFLSLLLLKVSSAGQNAASSYLSIRFPPLAALVCCYIRPMSSLRLTFLYENHWIRRARFYSCQSFLTYYIMGAVGFVWPNLGFSPKCLDPSPMLGYPKDDVCFALMP